MAARKSGRKAARPVRSARKSGSRSWKFITLVSAAALAAVLYWVMSPTGIFKPVNSPVSAKAASGKNAGKPSSSAGAVKTEAQKAAPKEAAPVEPKPVPVPVKPAPVAVVPAAPSCNGQPLSLFDIQGKVGNPSWKIVDVRPADRFSAGNIPGAVNIPAGDFDAAFDREQAGLAQGAGIILYGDGFSDPGVIDVCTKMAGKNLPRIYLFREGWSRWAPAP